MLPWLSSWCSQYCNITTPIPLILLSNILAPQSDTGKALQCVAMTDHFTRSYFCTSPTVLYSQSKFFTGMCILGKGKLHRYGYGGVCPVWSSGLSHPLCLPRQDVEKGATSATSWQREALHILAPCPMLLSFVLIVTRQTRSL